MAGYDILQCTWCATYLCWGCWRSLQRSDGGLYFFDNGGAEIQRNLKWSHFGVSGIGYSNLIWTCVTNNFKAVHLCLNDQIRLPCKKTRNGKCQVYRVLSYQFFSFFWSQFTSVNISFTCRVGWGQFNGWSHILMKF